jgi:hypothetical protein
MLIITASLAMSDISKQSSIGNAYQDTVYVTA